MKHVKQVSMIKAETECDCNDLEMLEQGLDIILDFIVQLKAILDEDSLFL